jgi:transcriptional regulator with XRE-family HTH domain
LGDRLRVAQALLDLSDTELAALLGITGGAVGKWKAENPTEPDYEKLQKIARWLRVPVEALMGTAPMLSIVSRNVEQQLLRTDTAPAGADVLWRLLRGRVDAAGLAILEELRTLYGATPQTVAPGSAHEPVSGAPPRFDRQDVIDTVRDRPAEDRQRKPPRREDGTR